MDKKRLILMGFALGLIIPYAYADAPAGYYDAAIGKSGSTLQNTLASIIDSSDPGYDALWDIYKTTDRRDDGKVWDMYSATSNFTFGNDKCGSYGKEGDCYNREHSIPKSWRGGSKYSDAHMVIPTDGYVNNRRSSYPFGEVGSSSYTSANGFSKLGTCVTAGYSGTVFEPADEYKGDFARIYFYAATRYASSCGSWGGGVFSSSFPHLNKWSLDMMLRWHRQDPVSQKEKDRNDAVYATRQHNRNPFVDYPELVELIFGGQTSTPFNPGKLAYIETPKAGETITVGTVALGGGHPSVSVALPIHGYNLSGNLTLSLSGETPSCFSLSKTSVPAGDVLSGTSVTIVYAPVDEGTHTALLTISGGGLGTAHVVTLSGNAREGFAAIDAVGVSDKAFTACWTAHSQASDYELSVWAVDKSVGSEPQTLLDTDFASAPDGWSADGYFNYESSALRLASSGNYGMITTPALDLSSSSLSLTVTCAPYRTSDNSVLYILVDGSEVARIDCSADKVTQTVALQAATVASSISFKANAKARVYLQHVALESGGSSAKILLDGYPCRVGNVLQYKVENLTAQADYQYKVVAYKGDVQLGESNVIDVTTLTSDVATVKILDGLYVYAYGGAIYVDGAPANARMNCYSLDGRLCVARTLHGSRESFVPEHKGVFVVQIITQEGSFSSRVFVR